MAIPVDKIRSAPPQAKLGIGLCLAGWVWLVLTLYYVYAPDFGLRFLIIAFILCSFLLMLKNWARMFAICFGAVLAVFFLVVAIVTFTQANQSVAVVAFVNALLFGTASYYLLLRPTADFFKAQDRSADTSKGDDEKQNG